MAGAEVAAAERPRVVGPGRSARARHLAGVLVLAGLYYGAAQVGYALDIAGPVAAIVWLPAGVGIAFLYLGGPGYWPGILIGDLLVNDYSALPLGSALGQTCGNLLEVLVAAELMRRLIPDRSPLGSVGGLARMLGAIAAGTLISAAIGTLSQLLGGVVKAGEVLEVGRTWWLGDASGALIVVPLAIAWFRPPPRAWWAGRVPEALLLLVAVIALSELGSRTHEPVAYIVFPALIWAALRFGQRGATVAVAVAVGVTMWNTAHLESPFVFDSITHGVVTTQLYMAVATLTTLVLAAVVSEREAFSAGLGQSRARLVEAADTERRRLEHDLHDGAQQRLTALAYHLHEAGERAQDSPEEAPDLFAGAEAELSLAIDELRELAHGIHPAVLTDLGLASAIETVAARATVPVALLELPTVRLDETAEVTAYYVVTEAVANAQKHAQASSIRVRAGIARGTLTVVVMDNGVGGATESPGSGLQGLRDRVEATGGRFRLDSVAGAGTCVAAAIPARQPAL